MTGSIAIGVLAANTHRNWTAAWRTSAVRQKIAAGRRFVVRVVKVGRRRKNLCRPGSRLIERGDTVVWHLHDEVLVLALCRVGRQEAGGAVADDRVGDQTTAGAAVVDDAAVWRDCGAVERGTALQMFGVRGVGKRVEWASGIKKSRIILYLISIIEIIQFSNLILPLTIY